MSQDWKCVSRPHMCPGLTVWASHHDQLFSADIRQHSQQLTASQIFLIWNNNEMTICTVYYVLCTVYCDDTGDTLLLWVIQSVTVISPGNLTYGLEWVTLYFEMWKIQKGHHYLRETWHKDSSEWLYILKCEKYKKDIIICVFSGLILNKNI